MCVDNANAISASVLWGKCPIRMRDISLTGSAMVGSPRLLGSRPFCKRHPCRAAPVFSEIYTAGPTWGWRPGQWTRWPPGRSICASWSIGWALGCSRCERGWRGCVPSPWRSFWEETHKGLLWLADKCNKLDDSTLVNQRVTKPNHKTQFTERTCYLVTFPTDVSPSQCGNNLSFTRGDLLC